MQIGTPPAGAAPGPSTVDVARLIASLQADPRPRLTWYGAAGDRVELTGRVLVTWVAKTAHLLVEEADVAPGSLVRVRLGQDWRAPAFWLAAWYLGAALIEGDADASGRLDVDVVPEGDHAAEVRVPDFVSGPHGGGSAVVMVVAAAALPQPLVGLPAGAVDYGAEVSAQPDQLPAPGPARILEVVARPASRVLLGPGARAAEVVATWAAGGSVVLHTGLDAAALARIREQENVTSDA